MPEEREREEKEEIRQKERVKGKQGRGSRKGKDACDNEAEMRPQECR